ncbi:gluconokinase [Pseudonocardia sp. N23]|uniref:gluconokinase n=1 Tax=Pseudonocardia sp. N23 TaxID=1987376 RepID=UPI000BFD3CEF|nr:gluconokinase [Pseudonocardia sp. N23]
MSGGTGDSSSVGNRTAGNGAGHVTTTLVVAGVSGSGKSTIGRAVAERAGWAFAEGDDLHPEANRRKMGAGVPLDDSDRWPWLRRVAAWIGAQERAGRCAVVTCSALSRRYRDLLREGHPSLRFVLLQVDGELLEARLRARTGHFMPASLLASQLAALEPLGADEPGTVVPAGGPVDAVVAAVLAEARA